MSRDKWYSKQLRNEGDSRAALLLASILRNINSLTSLSQVTRLMHAEDVCLAAVLLLVGGTAVRTGIVVLAHPA